MPRQKSLSKIPCVTARTPDCRDPDIIRNPLPGEDPNDNLQHSGEISKVIARNSLMHRLIKTSGVDLNASLGFDTNSIGGSRGRPGLQLYV